ncbi:MAG: hypothetical protein ABW194_03060 [Novosphingobium sp.]
MTQAIKKDRRVAIYGWIVLTGFLAFNLAALTLPMTSLPTIALYTVGALALIGVVFGIWGGIRLAKKNRDISPY